MAMVRKGGSKTKGGLYWKRGEWEIVTVEKKIGMLPGTEDVGYIRIPGILFAPLALILGLAFYLFLPLLGFAMLLSVIVKKIWGWFAPAALQPRIEERRVELGPARHTSRAAHTRIDGGVS
jgi:hypothetical protein